MTITTPSTAPLMRAAARRGLGDRFFADLQSGLLAPLRERVDQDRSVCLGIRGEYINVYYRGASVLRVCRDKDGYAAFFDTRYFGGTVPSMPPHSLRNESDVAAWLAALPTLKQAIDLWEPGEEREVQQLILRDNNRGGIARSTDFYVCDIEYANAHGRFDFVAVRWPSTSNARKRQDGHRLVLGEVKFGDAALDGTSGLHAHVNDINNYLAEPGALAALKTEMLRVFNQTRELGLIDCKKELEGFSDEPPLLLLVLVNHDPDRSRLRELLRTLPPSPHAALRVASSCLLGYGLYDPAILTIDEALTRLDGCI